MNDHPPRVPKASRRSNKLVERTEKKGPLTIRKTTPNRSPLINSPVKVCDYWWNFLTSSAIANYSPNHSQPWWRLRWKLWKIVRYPIGMVLINKVWSKKGIGHMLKCAFIKKNPQFLLNLYETWSKWIFRLVLFQEKCITFSCIRKNDPVGIDAQKVLGHFQHPHFDPL